MGNNHVEVPGYIIISGDETAPRPNIASSLRSALRSNISNKLKVLTLKFSGCSKDFPAGGIPCIIAASANDNDPPSANDNDPTSANDNDMECTCDSNAQQMELITHVNVVPTILLSTGSSTF